MGKIVGRIGSSALLAVLLASCSEFPNDANGTLDAVRAGRPLRVGWSAAEPWVRAGPDGPAGLEPDLVRDWARAMGARIEWLPAGEAQLVAALAENAVDLGLAGFDTDAPWGVKIGQTQPYLNVEARIGVAEGSPVPAGWTGVPVRFDRRRLQLAAALRAIGAEPVPVEPGGDLKPVGAAYAEELAALGLSPTGQRLSAERRVLAVPPAENALALALDRFLHGRRSWIRERLAAEAQPAPEAPRGAEASSVPGMRR